MLEQQLKWIDSIAHIQKAVKASIEADPMNIPFGGDPNEAHIWHSGSRHAYFHALKEMSDYYRWVNGSIVIEGAFQDLIDGNTDIAPKTLSSEERQIWVSAATTAYQHVVECFTYPSNTSL